MRGIPSVFNLKRWFGLALLMVLGTACSRPVEEVPPRHLVIQQQWQLQPGSIVGGRYISGGLGDISVELQGDAIHAPFVGKVQPFENNCLIYSTPEVPAYLFRLCGLETANLGEVNQGDPIGRGTLLQFATLRKQPSGKWAMVEPSSTMLERILTHP